MGYTHYWTQKRNFTVSEWKQIQEDIGAILTHAETVAGITLADGNGDGGTRPVITAEHIAFNGLGEDAHETFFVSRKISPPAYDGAQRGWDFCKTARKPYDTAVTACLCYLATATRREDPLTHEPILGSEPLAVTSDGDGSEWLTGLELARQALPRLANTLDLPLPIMESDRWCAPWVNCTSKKFEVHFCIDGKGYVLNLKTKESYCFESHHALALFLERTKRVDMKRDYIVSFGCCRDNYRIEKDIWNAHGSFDKARHARIEKAQNAVLAELFPVDPSCAQQPPAFVRPGEIPENSGRPFCYNVSDLIEYCTSQR